MAHTGASRRRPGALRRWLVAGQVVGAAAAVVAVWQVSGGWHALGAAGAALFTICQAAFREAGAAAG